jgi:hypothetical protein
MAGLLEKPYTVNQLMESIAVVLNIHFSLDIRPN